MKGRRLWLSFLFCIGSGAGIAYGALEYSENILALVFVPLTITLSYATHEVKKDEDNRKPQKYRLPHFTLGGFVIIGSILAAAGYFTSSKKIFIILYCVGMLILFIVGWAARKLAKSSEKTKVIDAMAWLLNSESTPSKIEPLLKKIGETTLYSDDEDSLHRYRARLLESLMPLLSSLITSPRTKMLYDHSQLKDLETYVSCLAQLSDFKDDSVWDMKLWWHLREDAKGHPILEDPLRKKMVELIQDSRSNDLTQDARVVLRKYGLDEHGDELPKQGFEVSGDASSMTTLTDLDSFYETNSKRNPRRKKGYDMVNAV